LLRGEKGFGARGRRHARGKGGTELRTKWGMEAKDLATGEEKNLGYE